MFENTQGKGFCIRFANGWAVSVQWGPENYCQNHDIDALHARINESFLSSTTAECAVINPEGEFHRHWGKRADIVNGYMTPDEVAKLLNQVARKRPVRV